MIFSFIINYTKLSIFFTVFVLFLFFPQNVEAIVDPLGIANNRVGIHILTKADIEQACTLVNGNGGEWGYVTLVIRQDDRDPVKWQEIFDEIRRCKIIPIVRIATYSQQNVWVRPTLEEANSWADFLGSLNWVVQNRYVVLFNEPNHSKEWGGTISPQEYAIIAEAYLNALKQKSPDFFVLPAGFDMAAPNSRLTMNAHTFWQRMYQQDKNIFSIFDGWTSHSYPTPSIKSYKEEMSYLKNFGLKGNIPVFITETGWVHREGRQDWPDEPDASTVSAYFEKAYQESWNDPQVLAVTPFVLNYTDPPFDHFSWIRDNGEPYPMFSHISQLEKVSGKPKIKNDAQIDKDFIPTRLITGSNYEFVVKVKNSGQLIWEDGELSATLENSAFEVRSLPLTQPGEANALVIRTKTPLSPAKQHIKVVLTYKGEKFMEVYESDIVFINPPTINIQSNLKKTWLNSKLLVYDENIFVQEITGVEFSDGFSRVKEVKNLVPGKNYRFVLIKKYFLPVQAYATFSETATNIEFSSLLPLDPNGDGKFSPVDIIAFIANFFNYLTVIKDIL